MFELWYNGALLAYKAGDFQISFEMVRGRLRVARDGGLPGRSATAPAACRRSSSRPHRPSCPRAGAVWLLSHAHPTDVLLPVTLCVHLSIHSPVLHPPPARRHRSLQVNRALEAYPEHTESHELLKQLRAHFSML